MSVIDGAQGTFSLTSKNNRAREYRKTAAIHAIQMLEPFTVDTEEGVMEGRAGDYLAEGPAGECWPIKQEIFEATYVQVDHAEVS